MSLNYAELLGKSFWVNSGPGFSQLLCLCSDHNILLCLNCWNGQGARRGFCRTLALLTFPGFAARNQLVSALKSDLLKGTERIRERPGYQLSWVKTAGHVGPGVGSGPLTWDTWAAPTCWPPRHVAGSFFVLVGRLSMIFTNMQTGLVCTTRRLRTSPVGMSCYLARLLFGAMWLRNLSCNL